MKATGQIVAILPLKEFPSGFAMRTLVINYTPEREHESYLVLDAKRGKEQDRTVMLDFVKEGQMVEVEFYPDGREWTSPQGEKKWFAANTLITLKPMDEAEQGDVPEPAVPTDAALSAGGDLPF